MQSQQNSAPHRPHVMWLHEPSSILTMTIRQRGQFLILSPVQHMAEGRRVIQSQTGMTEVKMFEQIYH